MNIKPIEQKGRPVAYSWPGTMKRLNEQFRRTGRLTMTDLRWIVGRLTIDQQRVVNNLRGRRRAA